MVSTRCKLIIKSELEALGIHYNTVVLGEVDIINDPARTLLDQFKINIQKSGFELLEDKKSIIIERIKNLIIEMIHYNDDIPKINYSEYISNKLNYDYNYLSNLFSEVKGITIEHFIISHKIEKVKELIIYNELTLTEIADNMHYSSVAHLSTQFKNTTGLRPSFFKNMKNKTLIPLENI